MEDNNVNIKVTVQTDKAVENLDNLKKSADKAAGSVEKVSKAGKDVDKSIPVAKDVGEAWEQAFDNITEALGPTGASLKKIFAAVKAAIPTVKALNKEAVTGLSKIKWAIAASGVGLLVLAIGELAAHWKEIAEWTGIGQRSQTEYNRAVRNLREDITSFDVESDRERALMEANRASQIELAQFDIETSEKRLSLLQEFRTQVSATATLTKRERKEQKELADDELNAEEHKLELLKQRKITLEAVSKVEKARANSEKNQQEELNKLEQLKADLQSAAEDAWATLTELAEKEQEGLVTSTDGYFTKLLDPKTATQDADEVVKHIEKAFKELNEKLGTDLKITPELYGGLLEGDKFSFNLQLEEQNAERERLFAEGKISLEENLKKELEIKVKAYENERELLLKRKEFLEKYGFGQDLEKVNSDLKILDQEIATYLANQNAKIEEASLNPKRKKLESKYLAKDRALKDEEFNTSFRRGLFKRSREYEQNQLAQIENQEEYYQELLNIEVDPDTRASILESLQDLETEKTRIEREGLEERKQIRLEEVQSYADAANGIADILGTVAEAEEERIQRQLDAGEISEEAAKSQFKTVKQWQYAQTWINTIAGMTAALTSPILNSTPAGWVAASTQAASLLATGIAQTIKIKNTQFNGGGVSSGGSGITASPSVTPIDVRDDIQQSPTVLPDSQSPRNQRVYILERDIQDSNRRVEIRENNSTF